MWGPSLLERSEGPHPHPADPDGSRHREPVPAAWTSVGRAVPDPRRRQHHRLQRGFDSRSLVLLLPLSERRGFDLAGLPPLRGILATDRTLVDTVGGSRTGPTRSITGCGTRTEDPSHLPAVRAPASSGSAPSVFLAAGSSTLDGRGLRGRCVVGPWLPGRDGRGAPARPGRTTSRLRRTASGSRGDRTLREVEDTVGPSEGATAVWVAPGTLLPVDRPGRRGRSLVCDEVVAGRHTQCGCPVWGRSDSRPRKTSHSGEDRRAFS